MGFRLTFSSCVSALGAMLCLLLMTHNEPLAQSPIQPGFQDVVLFSGLDTPTAVRYSPDGRVFVAEKSGLIKIFENLDDQQPTVFADLRTQVHNYWDRGLLGLALDPQFPTEPYVYVLYTRDASIGGTAPLWGQPGQTSDDCPTPPGPTDAGCAVSGRLSRLRAAGNVMTGSEQVLVDGWFQQFPSHSVGSIAFGPDSALYASGGEGASWEFVDYGQRGNPGGDPPVPVGGSQTAPTAEGGSLRAQDLRTTGDPVGLSGSIIRVDRRTGAPLPDNPLFSSSDANARRIVAHGFRNPFRIATRPGTNEVWVGDVGWRLWDEIDRIVDPRTGVRNFGWPCYEGGQRQPDWDAANMSGCETLYAQAGAVSFAHFQYKQGLPIVAGESCPVEDAAVSGLAFYRGGSYPAQYNGALFFADYARQCIWVMLPGADGVPDKNRVSTFITNAAFPVDLQVGLNGDLLYADIAGGTVHRITYTVGTQPPRAVATATPTYGQAPLTVTFDGSASSDPENAGPLTYSWDLDGNGTFGDSTAIRPMRTYNTNGTYVVQLRVRDVTGLTDTAPATVVVGNTPPTGAIDTPTSSLRWRDGQLVSFSGHATDAQDGTLGAAAFRWSLVMNHCSSPTSCHEHPIQTFTGVTSGSFTAVDHEYPSYLELRLTVTDSGGLADACTVRLDPAPGPSEIVIYATRATIRAGTWRFVADSTAADGRRLEHPNANAAKITTPAASPSHYVELAFEADAGRAYRLWLRGRAAGDSWANDSVYVQFDGSVNDSGGPVYRINTIQATPINLEECSGCGLAGWGWQDNGYGTGVLGPHIYFERTGPQVMRIQAREDGFSIDQVVLSSATYLDAAPGTSKNDATILPETGLELRPPEPALGDLVLYAVDAPVKFGAWRAVADPTAAGSARLEHPDAGAAKLPNALINPTHYFELVFNATARRQYHLWLRGRAARDSWSNDSVYVQFDGSVNQSGAAVYRIQTTDAAAVSLEDCDGCGLSGWGWQDNAYGSGVPALHIYFERTGPQTIRIQTRQDGLSIDQIVLSPSTYLTSSPGSLKNDTTILPRTP